MADENDKYPERLQMAEFKVMVEGRNPADFAKFDEAADYALNWLKTDKGVYIYQREANFWQMILRSV